MAEGKGPPMNRRSAKPGLAIALVATLACVIGVQISGHEFWGKRSHSRAGAAAHEVRSEDLPTLIDVNLAPPTKVVIRENSRNLFFYAKSPSELERERMARAAALRQAREDEMRQRLQAEAEARAAAAKAAYAAQYPPKPKAPPVAYRFIGKAGAPRAPLAILQETGPDGETYAVSEGEVLSQQFRVLKIDFDSVTIGYTNPDWAEESRVIRMGG